METQLETNSTSTDDNSAPIPEFVSAPKNPVRVGSVLYIFLENITPSYRRIPGIILMDPSSPSTTPNYRKNICQNLKSNFRNAISKPSINFQTRQPAKLVKFKKSPPRYAEIYRKKLETRKNLPNTFTTEETEFMPEMQKCCDEKSTSKGNLKNGKPSFIPVWVGHQNMQPNSASKKISTDGNDFLEQIYKSASRIPKPMLPIIPEESLQSLKSENLNNYKPEKMRADKSASETPIHKGNPKVQRAGKRISTKLAAKIPVIGLSPLPSQKNSKTDTKSNLPSSEALGHRSLAVGDGNSQIYEHSVSTPLEKSFMDIIYHSILSDEVSFEDAAKSLTKINPNILSTNYITLKGRGPKIDKVQFDGVRVTCTDTTETPTLSNTAMKDIEIDFCRAEEIDHPSADSPSNLSSPSSSLASFICAELAIINELGHTTENGQIVENGSHNSDEGIADLDINVSTIASASSQVVVSDDIPKDTDSPSNDVCSGKNNDLGQKTDDKENNDCKKLNDVATKRKIKLRRSAATFPNHRKAKRSCSPKVHAPKAVCIELDQIINSGIDPRTEKWEIRAKCIHSNLNIKKVDTDITNNDELTTISSPIQTTSTISSKVSSSVICIGQAVFPINDDLDAKTENEEIKTEECEISEESNNTDIGLIKSSISSLCQATFSVPLIEIVPAPESICTDQPNVIASTDQDLKAERDDMKTELNENAEGEINSNTNKPASVSSLCQATFSKSEISSPDEIIAEENPPVISKSNSESRCESDMKIEDKILDEIVSKEKMLHIRKLNEERAPSYFHGRPPRVCQRRAKDANKIVMDSKAQEEYTTYLRICLAAREGLLKQIHKSLAKGYMVFQARYAYLHKMDSDKENIGMNSDDDWKSLAKSLMKFLYWMNDFCGKGRNEIRNFERMNVFKGESKISRFFYNVNIEVAGEDMAGLFLPVPSL